MQLAVDVFSDSYEFNDDGVLSRTSPLSSTLLQTDTDATIISDYTFTGNTGFEGPVTSDDQFTSTGQPRVKAYLSAANQSIPNATATAVSFDAESFDVGGLHDIALLPDRIVITTGNSGLYLIQGQVLFSASITGVRSLVLYKNGTAFAYAKAELAPTAGDQIALNVQAIDQASSGDYYQLKVSQNSGTALDLILGSGNTFFTAMKVW